MREQEQGTVRYGKKDQTWLKKADLGLPPSLRYQPQDALVSSSLRQVFTCVDFEHRYFNLGTTKQKFLIMVRRGNPYSLR